MDRPSKLQPVGADPPCDDLRSPTETGPEASNPVLEACAEESSASGEVDQQTRENIQQILQDFKDNLSCSLLAKRKHFKQELNDSFKTLNDKLEYIFRREQNRRKEQHSKYCEIFESFCSQWQMEMQRAEEEDEKLAAMAHKQKEISLLDKMTRKMAIGTMKNLHETFMQKVQSLAENPPPVDESEGQNETSMFQETS